MRLQSSVSKDAAIMGLSRTAMAEQIWRRRVVTWSCAACAVFSALSGAAFGQGRGDRERGAPRLNIFISPSGEPFHASPGVGNPVDAWFAQADADHDGAITLQEFKADAEVFFHKLDTNHDGVIDGFEVSDYEQKIAPEILPRIGRLTFDDIPPLPDTGAGEHDRKNTERENSKPRPKGREGGAGGASTYMLMNEPEPVASADTDFDGKVTLTEALAAARRRFDELDVKHDGRLTRVELPQTPAEKMAAKAARKHQGETH